MNSESQISRRQFIQTSAIATASIPALMNQVQAKDSSKSEFKLNYIVGSSMYGKIPLAEILPEIKKTGTNYIDIWPMIHANQREQIKKMGEGAYAELLTKHKIRTGMLTHYDLGPFGLKKDIDFARRFNVKLMIAGSPRRKKREGKELKTAIKDFIEKLKPQIELFAEHGINIGIENHAHAIIDSPDSLRWFAEYSAPYSNLGIAMAPYHLPNDPELLAQLIKDIGDQLIHFYAWEHGMGSTKKLPKKQELMQMPGRGTLDYVPILKALKDINYKGWTEIFMHPVPRGIPILETASQVTAEINRSRNYLSECLTKI